VRSQRDREPVASLADAIVWLWSYSKPEDWLDGDQPMPLEALLVADMFWLNERDLRATMAREWRSVLTGARQGARRSFGEAA